MRQPYYMCEKRQLFKTIIKNTYILFIFIFHKTNYQILFSYFIITYLVIFFTKPRRYPSVLAYANIYIYINILYGYCINILHTTCPSQNNNNDFIFTRPIERWVEGKLLRKTKVCARGQMKNWHHQPTAVCIYSGGAVNMLAWGSEKILSLEDGSGGRGLMVVVWM